MLLRVRTKKLNCGDPEPVRLEDKTAFLSLSRRCRCERVGMSGDDESTNLQKNQKGGLNGTKNFVVRISSMIHISALFFCWDN